MDSNDFHPASPVEADQYLVMDEKPFTAFGQYGEGSLDNRVFFQDVWWVDVRGNEHLLTEMSTEYLRNVAGHIFSNIEYFHAQIMLRQAIEYTMTVLPTDFGLTEEQVPGFTDYVDSQERAVELTATEWMNSTPLVKRIFEILDEREN